jgi:DNA-binding Lrp family transcriptional regulator
MTVRAYILIEADQTRIAEIKDSLPEIELDGSRIVACEAVTGPYDLIATVESTDLTQLGR